MLKNIFLTGALILISFLASAQKKVYSSLNDAFMASMSLRGEPGPSGVNWMADGSSYSFTKREGRMQQIWKYSIEKGTAELVFSPGDQSFPGTGEDFSYRSSQWAGD